MTGWPRPSILPVESLLQTYCAQGAYTDCFTLEVPHQVSQAQFVAAFYTSPLFKVERVLLKWVLGKTSSDKLAIEMSLGSDADFSAWRVEARNDQQLLLCDFQGATRSWLMTLPVSTGEGEGTRLFFGSAVVATSSKSGKRAMPLSFRLLLGFHQLYAKALLSAAARNGLVG